MGDLDPHLIRGVTNTQTDTDRVTCDVCSNRPHLCSACRRCGPNYGVNNVRSRVEDGCGEGSPSSFGVEYGQGEIGSY